MHFIEKKLRCLIKCIRYVSRTTFIRYAESQTIGMSNNLKVFGISTTTCTWLTDGSHQRLTLPLHDGREFRTINHKREIMEL